MEGGELPQPREGLQAALYGDILFVTGGFNNNGKDFTSILGPWDPVVEFWQEAGDLAVGRGSHPAVGVPASTIAIYCTK